MKLYQQIFREDALLKGWERVRLNGGGPGPDRQRIEDFAENLTDNIRHLAQQLMNGDYAPEPLLKVMLSKKDREICIANVRDRVVQQTVYQVLHPYFEKDFLDCSYAYRHGKSAVQAAREIESEIRQGLLGWVVETDIQRFFDTIDHQRMLALLDSKIKDVSVVGLIEAMLKASVITRYGPMETHCGVNQGSALSPLLANIYLHELDSIMVDGAWKYYRYSDDLLVLADHQQRAEAALFLLQEQTAAIGLSLKQEKTSVHEIAEGFIFLGYYFDRFGKTVSVKAVESLKDKLAVIDQQADNLSFEEKMEKKEAVLRGWEEYFGFAEGIGAGDYASYCLCLNRAVKSNQSKEVLRIMQQRPGIKAEKPAQLVYEMRWLRERASFGYLVYELAYGLRDVADNGSIAKAIQDIFGVTRDAAEQFVQDLQSMSLEPGIPWEILLEWLVQHQLFSPVDELQRLLEELASPAQKIEPEETEASESLLQRYLELFGGRSDCYLYEWQDEGGRGYLECQGVFTRELVRQHLKGELTVAQYVVRPDNTAKYLVLDIDVPRHVLLELAERPEDISAYLSFAWQDVCRVYDAAVSLGLKAYLEFSGHRGYHCWIFFASPVKVDILRLLAAAVFRRAGDSVNGITRSAIPDVRPLKDAQKGPSIKLPLGRHGTSGKFSHFLDRQTARILSDISFIASIMTNDAATLDRLLNSGETASEKQGEDSAVLPGRPDFSNLLAKTTPQVASVARECHVMRHFIKQAIETGYLTHQERVALLMVFGHLGDDGKLFLHMLLSYCHNYRSTITDRYILRLLKPNTVSCARLRELFPEVTSRVGCDCSFSLKGSRYPAPIRHAPPAKVSQVTTPPLKAPSPELPPRRSEQVTASDDVTSRAAELVKKLTASRRQMKELSRNIERNEADLIHLLDTIEEVRVPVEMGILVIKLVEGRPHWSTVQE